MTAERWEQVAAAFEAARSCPAGLRAETLRRCCGGDAGLEAEVEALLAGDAAAGGFLSRPGSGFEAEPGAGEGAAAWAAGTVLGGRFRILRLLGRGGMGEVYAALDLELEAEVALKLIRPAIAADPRMLTRLKREILTARRISHPHVCRIHDLAVHGEGEAAASFLTMELLVGETLAERLRRAGKPPEAEARRWLGEIAAGLDAAHAAGVVHRDLKPGNVMLCADGEGTRAVVTDFGLARWAAAEEDAAASGSRLIGTLAYMAPEQLSGGAATAASDVYAFGLVAYELLTGERTFGGSGPFGGVLQRLQGPYPAPSERAPGIAPGWDRAIAGCLREDPAERFSSATAALEAVGEAQARRRRRVAVRPLGMALATAAVLMALAGGIYRYSRVRPQIPAGAEILLTPVVNATSDPQLDSTSTVLRQQLAQSAQFELTGDAEIQEQFHRMNRPATEGEEALAQQPALAREVAMRRGAPLVVFATLTRLAGQYRLDLEVERVGHDPDAAARRWSTSQTAGAKDEVFDALHAGATWVRTLAGEQGQDLASTDQPPQDITTPSWEALSYYSRAEAERSADRTPQAIALLQQAVATDPGFALAYTRLGDILVSQQRYYEGYNDYRQALALAEKRRLSQRERLRLEGLYDSDLNNYTGAVASFQAYAALYPRDYLGWFYQGWPEMQLGQAAKALAAWRQAQRLAPQQYYPAASIAFSELWAGDGTAAKAAAVYVRQTGAAASADELDASIALAQGDYVAGEGLLAALGRSADPHWRSLAALMQGDALAERGQYRQAEAVLRQGLGDDQSHGSKADEADKHLGLAYLELKLGHRAVASRECEAALQLDTSLKRLAKAGAMLAQNGDIADARRTLALLHPGQDLQPLAGMVADRLQGEILLAEGKPQLALPRLQAAAQAAGATEVTAYVARGLEAAGQPRPALELYEHWAQSPATIWYLPMLYLPGRFADLVFQAARLSDRLGRPDARARWQQYLRLRADADPDLPEVIFARQRLQALAVTEKGIRR